MNITFWVTQDCNLSCSYCYNKAGNNIKKKYMTEAIINDALLLFSKTEAWQEASTLNITFHGGEPLLNPSAIEVIMRGIGNYNLNKEVLYGMTTNGTIYGTREKHIIEMIDDLSISLDGRAETHDRNRVFTDGTGSFNLALSNAKKINKYKDVRLRITVTKETLSKLHETVIYFADMGFKQIMPILDIFDSRWEGVDEEDIINQFNQIKEQIKDAPYEEIQVGWVTKTLFTRKGRCDGGIKNFHILPNGDLYPCSLVVGDEEWIIGNVNDGLYRSKIDKIQRLNDKITKSCVGCELYEYCPSSRCKLINKKITGDFLTASVITCIESRLQLRCLN